MTPVGLPAGETPVESAQAWTCTVCNTEQVGLLSRGCPQCGAGTQQAFKAAAEAPPAPTPVEEAVADVSNDPMPAREDVQTWAKEDRMVTVYRLIEYYGPRDWVHATISRSLDGEQQFSDGKRITASLLTDLGIPPMFHHVLERARRRPTRWLGQQVKTATPTAAPDAPAARAVQLWQNVGEENDEPLFELVAPRLINTLIAALMHFASEAEPEGGESSMSAQECTDLALALGKGHAA